MTVPNEDNFAIQSFTGINETDPGSTEWIDPSQLWIANNVFLWPDGSLRKRFPIKQFTTLAAGAGPVPAIKFFGQLTIISGLSVTSYSVYGDLPAKNYYYSTDNSQSTSLIAGLAGKTVWDALQFNNKMYFACEEGLFVWAGGAATATQVTGAPVSMRKLVLFRNILFGAVNDTLYWCEPGDPTQWLADNILLISAGDGDTFSCMAVFHDTLLIAKTHSLHQLHFTDNPLYWFLRCAHPKIGCWGNQSMKVTDNQVFLYDRNAMWVTDLVTFTKLFDQGWIDSPASSYFSLDNSDNTVSIYKEWVIFSSRGFGVRAFHLKSPQGFTSLSFDSTHWLEIAEQVQLAPVQSRWLISVGNKLYEFCPHDDAAGDTVSVDIRTKAYDMERISHTKRMKYATIMIKGKGYNLTWIRDEVAETPAIIVPATSTGTISSIKVAGAEYGRTFSLRITESSKSFFGFYGFNFILHSHRQQSLRTEAV